MEDKTLGQISKALKDAAFLLSTARDGMPIDIKQYKKKLALISSATRKVDAFRELQAKRQSMRDYNHEASERSSEIQE